MTNISVFIGSDGLVLICPSDVWLISEWICTTVTAHKLKCAETQRVVVGKYVYDRGLTDKTQITLETLAGIKILDLNVKDGELQTVRVNMGSRNLFRKIFRLTQILTDL